jgi:hypothetical protein
MSVIGMLRQEPFHVCCGFSFAMGGKKKTAGKNSQPFPNRSVLQSPWCRQSYFGPALEPLKLERLEVVVFQRAGAQSVAAADG